MTPELQELIEAARAWRLAYYDAIEAAWPVRWLGGPLGTKRTELLNAIDAYDAANKPPLHEQVKALLPEGWRLLPVTGTGPRWEVREPVSGWVVLVFHNDRSTLTAEEIVDMALKLVERRGE